MCILKGACRIAVLFIKKGGKGIAALLSLNLHDFLDVGFAHLHARAADSFHFPMWITDEMKGARVFALEQWFIAQKVIAKNFICIRMHFGTCNTVSCFPKELGLK